LSGMAENVGEYVGGLLVQAGVRHLRMLSHGISPEARLLNDVAEWYHRVDTWRDRYLTDEKWTPNLAAVNEDLLFLADNITKTM
jgi:hypothetical protein